MENGDRNDVNKSVLDAPDLEMAFSESMILEDNNLAVLS